MWCKATRRLQPELTLVAAWASAAQWRVLDVGAASSAHFLRTWNAWRADAQRPRMLHFVALCSGDFKNTGHDADLTLLAEQLDAQLWGLLPGFHRLAFDGGQVLLTLCVGDVSALLKQQQFEADSVFLDFAACPEPDTLHTAKAIARLCRRGSALTIAQSNLGLQAVLNPCGFEPSGPSGLHAVYNPNWSAKKALTTAKPGTCIVIGAGLAGAAVASSLARRGWAVTVLDAAGRPASGASSLPAGLLVAHTSPDDSPLSRLSRCGVRMTLQQARAVLQHGTDWGQTGVLQRSLQGGSWSLPVAWAEFASQAADWCYSASDKTLAAAGLPADTAALWHAPAGWVQPAALVRAWLAAPGVRWRGHCQAVQLKPFDNGWRVLDAAGTVLAQADLVVVSAGYASQALATAAGAAPPDLQPIRGQVTFGSQSDSAPLPPFPVNGNGGLIPAIMTPGGPLWLMGASYERDAALPDIKAHDHSDNLARLQTLLPQAAVAIADEFDPQRAQGWAGVRCATPNRLPLVMPLADEGAANRVWLCTGMGSRGLSFAALCAELLAARIHAEPLPVDLPLAKALMRQARKTL